MYCKKCGKPNDNDAIFCKSCGARLGAAATYQPKPNTATSPKRAKKKFPIIIVIAVLAVIAIAATVFVGSTALTAGKYGRKNYEDVVSEYVEACCNLDGEKLLSLYPKDLVEEIYEHSGVSKEDVYRYYSNWLSTTEIFSASLDDTWEISFDSEEPYGYTGIQRIEPMYRKAGFDFDLEDGTTIKYSLRYSQYEAEWNHRNIELNLIKVDGRWYIDDVLMNDVFFNQDLSEIASIVQGIDEQELIAKYLGCDQKRLRGPTKHTIDGESHFTFEYWNGHGNYFDYQLYLLQDGNNTRVMARYWNKTIPVEELPEGERDSSWKITFTNGDKPSIENRSAASFSDIADLEGMTFVFDDDKSVCIELGQNGQFNGRIHLSSNGNNIYVSDFHGCFTNLEKIDDYTYTMRVSNLEYEGTPGVEEAIGEFQYIYSAPDGIENHALDNASEFYLYLPGSAAENLPKKFLESVKWQIVEEHFSERAFLYNATQQAAFFGGFEFIEWGEIGKTAISATNHTVPAYPDGNKRKTPVAFVSSDDADINWEEMKTLATEQKPALIKYLGCSDDNLWPNIGNYYMQGDVRKVRFWYVDDYREILGTIILLEDGTAAWCDESDIDYWVAGKYYKGELIVNTIEKDGFKNTQNPENIFNAKELSESEQKTKIAQHLGINEEELEYCGINTAGRIDFGSNPVDEFSDLRFFLLDDGTVAAHTAGSPPFRVEDN